MSTKPFKNIYFVIALSAFFFINRLNAQCPKLVFSDEFDSTALDQKKWSYQIGDGCDLGANLCGWGNNELEWYAQDNVQVSNGTLKITAKQQTINNRNYTSGKIRTINKADFKYGRIEARMKMPIGRGLWPAFWMLSTNEVYGSWPKSGEIDIVEYLGHENAITHGTMHYGKPYPNNSYSTGIFTLADGGLDQDFHIYALEWSENSIKWFVDGYLYLSKTNVDVGTLLWPFDQNFHLILNLAVGGNLPGNPNGSTVFPQTFEVDYVRVYDMVGAPFLSGVQKASFMQKNTAYSLGNVPAGSTIAWSVPVGASIVSGAGTTAILVNWGSMGGKVAATITKPCGDTKVELVVKVSDPAPVLSPSIVLENFDSTARITRTFNSGTFTDKTNNPAPNDINKSALCGKYVRSAGSQYDVLFYDVSDITYPNEFVTGIKKFYIDIYTDAPVGTNILLQLEDKTRSTSSNFPRGRNSRYTAVTTKKNEWERLSFDYTDQPDPGTVTVNQLILLFSPNTFNGSTYYFDNFTIYAKSLTSTLEIDKEYQIALSPNPALDFLNISVNKDKSIESIEVYDVAGRKISAQNNIRNTELHLDTHSFNSGVYFINISFKDAKQIVKAFVISPRS